WHLTIEDTIDNLGRTFLGFTINCSRCHDHKFDPFTNDDYYALYGIFQSTRYPWPGIELEQKQRDFVPLVPAEQAEALLKERLGLLRRDERDEVALLLFELDPRPGVARALEDAIKRVVVVVREGIELVVVAARAIDRESQEGPAEVVDRVLDREVP